MPSSSARRRRAVAGTATLEFGLLLPFVALLLTGVAEAALYMRSWHRLERVAAEVANLVAQHNSISRDELVNVFDAANQIAAPWTAWGSGGTTPPARLVVSLVSGTAGGNQLSWSCARGAASLTPQFAARATLPNGFVVPNFQSVIVVEVISAERRWTISASSALGLAPDAVVRTYAILRPRQATLSTLTNGCPA